MGDGLRVCAAIRALYGPLPARRLVCVPRHDAPILQYQNEIGVANRALLTVAKQGATEDWFTENVNRRTNTVVSDEFASDWDNLQQGRASFERKLRDAGRSTRPDLQCKVIGLAAHAGFAPLSYESGELHQARLRRTIPHRRFPLTPPAFLVGGHDAYRAAKDAGGRGHEDFSVGPVVA